MHTTAPPALPSPPSVAGPAGDRSERVKPWVVCVRLAVVSIPFFLVSMGQVAPHTHFVFTSPLVRHAGHVKQAAGSCFSSCCTVWLHLLKLRSASICNAVCCYPHFCALHAEQACIPAVSGLLSNQLLLLESDLLFCLFDLGCGVGGHIACAFRIL